MAPLGPGSPFRPRSRGRIRADTSPPPVPAKTVANTPKNFIDLNSSTRSADPIRPDRWATQPGRPEIARRAFLCDVIVDYDNDETNVLLSRLGEPLPRMTTLPAKNACPTTPRKSEDDDENAISSLSALEEQQRRLQSLIEELVRTERSYVSRLRALKKASLYVLTRLTCSELRRPIATLCQTVVHKHHPGVRSQGAVWKHRRCASGCRDVPCRLGDDVGQWSSRVVGGRYVPGARKSKSCDPAHYLDSNTKDSRSVQDIHW